MTIFMYIKMAIGQGVIPLKLIKESLCRRFRKWHYSTKMAIGQGVIPLKLTMESICKR